MFCQAGGLQKMGICRKLLVCAAILAGAGGVTYAAPATSDGHYEAMPGLRDGVWELRQRGSRAAERVCLKAGVGLIQLRHPGKTCERIVIEQTATMISVQYTCRGSGFGRTTIRRETPQLIQLETQGVANGFPFEYAAEGRWMGECARSPG